MLVRSHFLQISFAFHWFFYEWCTQIVFIHWFSSKLLLWWKSILYDRSISTKFVGSNLKENCEFRIKSFEMNKDLLPEQKYIFAFWWLKSGVSKISTFHINRIQRTADIFSQFDLILGGTMCKDRPFFCHHSLFFCNDRFYYQIGSTNTAAFSSDRVTDDITVVVFIFFLFCFSFCFCRCCTMKRTEKRKLEKLLSERNSAWYWFFLAMVQVIQYNTNENKRNYFCFW